jgi:hypothetical protein
MSKGTIGKRGRKELEATSEDNSRKARRSVNKERATGNPPVALSAIKPY